MNLNIIIFPQYIIFLATTSSMSSRNVLTPWHTPQNLTFIRVAKAAGEDETTCAGERGEGAERGCVKG